MSELSSLLDGLPVPDHAPDFWTNLEAELADTTSPATTAPSPDDPPVDLRAHIIIPDLDVDQLQRRSRRRWVIVAAAAAAAIVAFILGLSSLGEDSGPGPVVTEPTPPPTLTALPNPSTAPPTPDTAIEANPDGGLADEPTLGPRSAGLPITLSESSGLTEGSAITVAGSGFAPGAQIAIAQCFGPVEVETGVTPDVGVCDLSNYMVISADMDSGDFSAEFTPRRFISTADGTIDCAYPDPQNSCVIAAADIADLAELGILAVDFDPTVAGAAVPTLEVSATEGLAHNQVVVVEGSGFEPGELVHLSSCPLNPDFRPCMVQRGATRVTADATGAFVVDLRVQQFVESMLCAPDPGFDCQIAALASRAPNPVAIRFADDPSGSTPWLTPAGVFAHGETVRFQVPIMNATPGETFEARQCVDGQELIVNPDRCGEPVTGTVDDGGITFDLEVQAYAADAYSAGEIETRFRYLDCQGVGSDFVFPTTNRCHIRVETPSYVFPQYAIAFAEGEAEAARADVNDR